MTKAYVAAWPDERTGAGGRAMNKLFCDLKTDEEKAEFFLSGRGYETGVIAHSIQNDVAMAYHRCAEYKKELAALRAENDRLTRYYKNGIDCFANPCEEHSGERTPPFPEFFERYGGQCLICVVDNNKTLQAERDALLAERDALRKDAERYRWLRDPCSGAERVIFYCRGDYGRGLMSSAMLDAAIDAALQGEQP